jgi:hypothetical protein
MKITCDYNGNAINPNTEEILLCNENGEPIERFCVKCKCAEKETLDGFIETNPCICEDCFFSILY